MSGKQPHFAADRAVLHQVSGVQRNPYAAGLRMDSRRRCGRNLKIGLKKCIFEKHLHLPIFYLTFLSIQTTIVHRSVTYAVLMYSDFFRWRGRSNDEAPMIRRPGRDFLCFLKKFCDFLKKKTVTILTLNRHIYSGKILIDYRLAADFR